MVPLPFHSNMWPVHFCPSLPHALGVLGDRVSAGFPLLWGLTRGPGARTTRVLWAPLLAHSSGPRGAGHAREAGDTRLSVPQRRCHWPEARAPAAELGLSADRLLLRVALCLCPTGFPSSSLPSGPRAVGFVERVHRCMCVLSLQRGESLLLPRRSPP